MAKVVGWDVKIQEQLRITCKGCGAIIQYEKHEIQKYSGTDISGGPDGRWWVDCPHCKDTLTIKSW